MKKTWKLGLSTLALVFGLTSCGSSGGGGSNNANNPYTQCGTNQNCNTAYFNQLYGPNTNGYYGGTMNYGGYQCPYYNVPQYQSGCNSGCGTQQYVVVPQGAYIPSQNIYGSGGSFYVGGSW